MIWQEWAFIILTAVGMTVFIVWAYRNDTAALRPSNVKEVAEIADPLAEGLLMRRAQRRKSHNEWLEMWYNALPLDRQAHFAEVWETSSLDFYHSMLYVNDNDAFQREKRKFLLNCVENMVHTLSEGGVPDVVGDGRIRGYVMRSGGRDVLRPVGAAVGPKKDACASCGCGPNSAC